MTRTLLTIAFAIGLAGTVAHAQTPEGIRVRGQWTIDVRNPDGSLVEHREFDNALLSRGAWGLAEIMSRTIVPGRWSIILSNACLLNGNPFRCEITEPMSTPSPDAWEAHTLEVSFCNVSASYQKEACKGKDLPSYALVLSGNIKAQRDGIIDAVTTSVQGCEATSSPLLCLGKKETSPYVFTDKLLATPVGVLTGQIVEVKVAISFSSK